MGGLVGDPELFRAAVPDVQPPEIHGETPGHGGDGILSRRARGFGAPGPAMADVSSPVGSRAGSGLVSTRIRQGRRAIVSCGVW